MSVLLGILLGISVLGLAAVGATVFSLRASDPAGNALAEVYLVVAVAALWLLLGVQLLLAALWPPRPELPARNLAAALLFAVALASQVAGLVVLSRDAAGVGGRLAVQLALLGAPLLVILHVAWRTFLPLPAPLASGGLAALLVAACLVPWPWLAAPRTPPQPRAPKLAFPALLLHAEAPAEIVSDPSRLSHLPADLVATGARLPPTLIDATPAIYELRDLRQHEGTTTFELFLDAPSPSFEDVRALVLRWPRLSDKPAREAALRAALSRSGSLAELLATLRESR